MNANRKFDPDAFLAALGTDHDPAKVARVAKVGGEQPIRPANFSRISDFSSQTAGNVVSLLDRIRLAARASPDDIEERAAIAEYEGGLPREEAERQAEADCGLLSDRLGS